MVVYSSIRYISGAQKKPSFGVFVQEVAGSPTPGCSAMNQHCHGVPSPLEGNDRTCPTPKTERALAPSATDPEKGATPRDKQFSSFLEPVDARRLSSVPLPDSDQRLSAYPSPLSSPSRLRATTKAYIPVRLVRFWQANRSCLLVVISSLFGSAMALFTKLLELGGDGMHPFLILFIRMIGTTIVCTGYLWRKKIPNSLLGQQGVRGLLLCRGVFGFIGIVGIWTAIQFLSLADATVITFLTPALVGFFSAIFLRYPYTRKEQLASLAALTGVIFIARPSFLFDHSSHLPPGGVSPQPSIEVTPVSTVTDDGRPVTQPSSMGGEAAAHRLTGILFALLSALGNAGAIISIKSIGDRAHVITMTNLFSICSTVICTAALTIAPLVGYGQPQLHFGLPQDLRQWMLVSAITVCGFLTQWLQTLGLSSEGRSNKAPAMTYTGMLWTVGFDRWIFGQSMYWTSFLGCALVVGSAIWVVLLPKPKNGPQAANDIEDGAAARRPEATPMTADMDAQSEGDEGEKMLGDKVQQ